MARSDRNWAHSPDFGRGAMVDFEKRLGRAQARRRPGYLRVKAATLLAISDSRATKIALDLLHRVVDGYTDFLEVPRSHELLGDAYLESGELKAAEAHLRLAIARADDNRNGLGLPELSLAEVLLEQDRFEDAQQALNDVQSLRRGMIWNAQLYRFAVASARCALHSGTDAASWAQAALDLANVEAPQLPRHPTVGLVVSNPRTLKEMRKIVRTA